MFVMSAQCRRDARAHRISVDLLRVVLRVRAREARGGVRRRLAEDFAGYLVSDSEQVESKPAAVDVDRDSAGKVMVITAPVVRAYGLRPQFGEIEVIDAPNYLPAGSVYRWRSGSGGEYAADRRFFRDRWAG